MKPRRNLNKYIKVEIPYKSEAAHEQDCPTHVLLMFSRSDLIEIKKHMEYAKDNGVVIKKTVMYEKVFYDECPPEDDSLVDSFMEHIYIYPSCLYYKAASDDMSLWMESESFTLDDLKHIKEWAFELENFED